MRLVRESADGGLWPLEGLPIVCFANDWQGDPTSKHHVMRLYAGATEVLWIEAAGMRRPQWTKGHDLRRVVAKLRGGTRGARQVTPGLSVISPVVVPAATHPATVWLNAGIYQRAVTRAARRAQWDRAPVVWVYTPTVAPYLRGIPTTALVYHCVDRWWEFPEYHQSRMRGHHEWLCRHAAVVFASSRALLEDCRQYTALAYHVPHGVEWAHFSAAALVEADRPADIADIKGPIVGFFGLLHHWIDQELIARVAAEIPGATVVLIGKQLVDVGRLSRLPNVRLLGQKPYDVLPAYCAAFDVALIPFVRNALTDAVNPIKLWEYLSAGLPTVATALPEVVAAGEEGVTIGRDAEEFVAGVLAALAESGNAARRRDRAAGMARHGWEARCRVMADLVRTHLPDGGGR